jgi:hypothetical protein
MAPYRPHVIRRQYRAPGAPETMKKTAIATIFRVGDLP